MLPNKWGQGQLFAFSALDGESLFSDDFSGILSGDKIGVIFQTKCRRTIFYRDMEGLSPSFRCVTSDMISLETNIGEFSMIFLERHLVVGKTADMPGVFVGVDGECEITEIGDIEIHNTSDGDFTGLLRRNNKFAFAYGKDKDSVIGLCEKGINLDFDELVSKKKKYYDFSLNRYDSLCAKCLSVMKSQLYSPEGNIRRIWSTPDRLPHRNMWLWDSVFHAIGHRHINSELAENLILALFDVQKENGFIPHMAKPFEISSVTQPPVIAWGSYLVYEKSKNKDFLKNVLERNKAFLLWCRNNRRKTDKELYSWHTKPELNNRCDESGMDNSPRFDTSSDLFAIDFSCYMANETRFMKKIAEELGDSENADYFSAWHEKIKSDINDMLWCEEDGFYYDYDINGECFSKVQSVASFLPVFASCCDDLQCKKLIQHLENPEEFGTDFPIPSISKKDKSFGTDMWRGPVWINYNYMISNGLSDYGYNYQANRIKERTVEVINEWYNRTGTVFEFYDSENRTPPYCFNRKGAVVEPYDFRVNYQSIRDYGWSITIVFDILCDE